MIGFEGIDFRKWSVSETLDLISVTSVASVLRRALKTLERDSSQINTFPPYNHQLSTMSTILHVRAETKPLEHRSAVTPSVAKKLVEAGYTVNVERSALSIFDDTEYEGTGANLVPTGSWTDAPKDHIVVGLKELPEEDFPLKHTVSTSRCWSERIIY